MLNLTQKALEEFDNHHDFERMCADILNGQGYQTVEPIAPTGGPDGGKDIVFYEGETKCVSFVTLRKDIKKKFAEDLQKLKIHDGFDKIVLFSNQKISQKQRKDFYKSTEKKGIHLEIYDLERLRSLLDVPLKDIRKKYLHIDDEVSEKILTAVKKTLDYPDLVVIEFKKSNPLEALSDIRVRKLFYTLFKYDEKDVSEIPHIGNELNDFQLEYDRFRRQSKELYPNIIESIRPLIKQKINFAEDTYAIYCIYRFFRYTREKAYQAIENRSYGIIEADTERVYQSLLESDDIFDELSPFKGLKELQKKHEKLAADVNQITERLKSMSEK